MKMRLLMASLFLASATCAGAATNAEKNQWRQNLVDLSVPPKKFVGQTKRVFCPIAKALADTVQCYVLNERLQVIGAADIIIDLDDPEVYSDYLNRCVGGIGAKVGDECAALVDVFVDGDQDFQSLIAKKIVPLE